MELVEDSDIYIERISCSICGRKFIPKSLMKHSAVCEKISYKKRKKFDSARQRIQGTELTDFLPAEKIKRNEVRLIISKGKSSTVLKAVRTPVNVLSKKSGGRNHSLLEKSPTYDRCPHCDRSFGPRAFDRHIEWCKEQNSRINFKSLATQEAKERLDARTKYQAPFCTLKRISSKKRYSLRSHHDPSSDSTVSEEQNESVTKSCDSELKLKLSETSKLNGEPNFTRRNFSICSYKSNPSRKSESKIEKELNNRHCKQSDFSELQDWIVTNGSHLTQLTNLSKQVPNFITNPLVHENYDPFVQAEYQLRELLGDCQSNNEHTNQLYSTNYLSTPVISKDDRRSKSNKENILCNSASSNRTPPSNNYLINHSTVRPYSASTFDKCWSEESKNINLARSSNPSVLDSDNDKNEKFLPAIMNKTESYHIDYETLNSNRYPLLSLNNVTLCSSLRLEIPDKCSETGTSRSAKIRSNKQQLPVKRSISVTDNKIKSKGKKNVLMQNTLFNGEKGNFSTYTDESLKDYEQRFGELNSMLDGANSDFMNSFTEFENMLQNCYNDTKEHVNRSESPIEQRKLSFMKMNSDSAYNSLSPSRKSHCTFGSQVFSNRTSTPDTETSNLSVVTLSIESSDLNSMNERKLSKFCHECGARYPLYIAKFCCECGVRRLFI